MDKELFRLVMGYQLRVYRAARLSLATGVRMAVLGNNVRMSLSLIYDALCLLMQQVPNLEKTRGSLADQFFCSPWCRCGGMGHTSAVCTCGLKEHRKWATRQERTLQNYPMRLESSQFCYTLMEPGRMLAEQYSVCSDRMKELVTRMAEVPRLYQFDHLDKTCRNLVHTAISQYDLTPADVVDLLYVAEAARIDDEVWGINTLSPDSYIAEAGNYFHVKRP